MDVLNPIQPDVMDPEEVWDSCGDRLALWGAVGTQTLWAWSRPKDVEEEVRSRLGSMGQNGGYVVCPAYDVGVPEVPLENIVAFVEAARKFGAN